MKIRTCILLLSVFLISSCDEVEDLLTFHINDHTAIRIESGIPLDLPLSIQTPSVSSNSQQQYENHNTRADLVKDVKLEELKLTITNPSGKTFSFLETIRIFISASGQPEIELASLENVAATADIITLLPTTQKLDAYAKASSYTLRTEITTDEALTESVDIQVDLKFRVTADTF